MQSNDALWGIANELTSGPHKIARDAVTVTLGEGLKDPEQLESLLTESDAIGISAGTKLIKAARSIISLNGLEPTSKLKLIKEMGREKMSNNDGHIKPDVSNTDFLKEFFRSPSMPIRVLHWAKHFSTVNHMIKGGRASFPEGRLYLPTDDDEYGFGNNGEVQKALEHGIYAKLLPGTHGEAVLRPREHSRRIKEALETAGV